VFIQSDVHHPASSFAVRGEEPNQDSIVIYTWKDASLRELAELIQQVNPEARSPNRDISFAFVYPDRTGTNVVKHVATISSAVRRGGGGGGRGRGAAGASSSSSDSKTLQELKFETGDSLSVALLKKAASASAAAAAP
jgi:histone deacetylase complex subunit SAP18